MIANKIKKMKDNKSPGVDGIPPKLLKEIVEQISTPLAKLFNLSLEEGIVPSEWKEANITPLFKKGSIMYKEKQLIVPLYKAIVRPHLKYCIQAWRTYRKKDIDKLKRIQRRATKMIPELRDLSYESRLLQFGLTTLETRRLRGEVFKIEVFKIVNGYEDVERNMFFKLKEGSRTRGHKAALVKEQCRLDMRKYSFSQRVINEWKKTAK